MTSFLWPILVILFSLIAGAAALAGLRSGTRRSAPKDERAAELLAAGLLPLVDCPRDRDACLKCLHVDRCVVHRLLEMGLTPGTPVRVVQDAGGPMLVSVRGSRVALGRDLAARMWVELPATDSRDPQS